MIPAFDKIVPQIRPGVTERDLAMLLDRIMANLGAERPAFDTTTQCHPSPNRSDHRCPSTSSG